MITKMSKVLFIAYAFPPLLSSESLRSLRSVKYMTKTGINLTVLTTNRYLVGELDHSMLRELPVNLSIKRAYSPFIVDFVPFWVLARIQLWNFSPFYHFGWLPFAVRKGKKIIEHENIDAIVSRSMPYASHLVALVLKKSYNLPWIADFSDPWVQGNSFNKYKSKIFKRIDVRLESAVAHSADKIIFTTTETKVQFLNEYKDISEDKVIVIPNSYDPEDYDVGRSESEKSLVFTIVHVGTFYGQRSPDQFLKAIRSLREEHKNLALKIRFVGSTKFLRESVEK
jgi:glycosyltransferase involved in cell wall biosynthesis